MPRKTLDQVAPGDVIHSLAPIAEFIETNVGHQLSFEHGHGSVGDMSLKEVWGVKEAKTQLTTLLREASAGEIHFVTAGDGVPIVMMNANHLAEAMATLDRRRGRTLADAVASLPYAPSELKRPARHHRSPERGMIRRAQAAQKRPLAADA